MITGTAMRHNSEIWYNEKKMFVHMQISYRLPNIVVIWQLHWYNNLPIYLQICIVSKVLYNLWTGILFNSYNIV